MRTPPGARGGATSQDGEHGDVAFLERARAGDPAVLKTIVQKEAGKVAGLLLRLLGPRADLEDLVQIVFLELCRALPRFRGGSTLSTFIGGIAVQVARRTMRGTPWQRRRAPWPEIEPASPAPSPEAISRGRRQLERLHRLLDDVPARKRVAFLLWAVQGCSAEEVAQLTGSSLATARKRIYDVRSLLRERASQDPLLASYVTDEEA